MGSGTENGIDFGSGTETRVDFGSGTKTGIDFGSGTNTKKVHMVNIYVTRILPLANATRSKNEREKESIRSMH